MGPLEGPCKWPHGRRVQEHALPTLRGHERVAGEGAGDSQPPTESHGPGLSFDFLLPVQALRVRGLGQALADGGLGAAAVQAVQVGPGLL